MSIKEYFGAKEGTGILATADSSGRVDAAIYSRPFVIREKRVAFIMADRLTRRNLLSNPNATYLFIEAGPGYNGMRLMLVLEKELGADEVDHEELRGHYVKAEANYPSEKLTVMYFKVEKVLPLVS